MAYIIVFEKCVWCWSRLKYNLDINTLVVQRREFPMLTCIIFSQKASYSKLVQKHNDQVFSKWESNTWKMPPPSN